MKLFVDTSALVKFFHDELGSDLVTKLLLDPDNEIWMLDLARVEFLSALFRRRRNNEINDQQLTIAISGFEEEWNRFHIEPMNPAVVKEAEDLIKRYGEHCGLRTLDALHGAAFVLVGEIDWAFVASDKALCSVIAQIGYQTINPMKDEIK